MVNDVQTEKTDPKTWAIAVWALYLGSAITGITGLIGLIIAYVKRDDLSGTIYELHVTSAIRTFWIGLVASLIGVALSFLGVGLLIIVVAGIWGLFRTVRGLIKAIDGKPIDDPEGWL